MTRRNRSALVAGFVMVSAASLGGCESTARQDPVYVRNSSDALVFTDTAFFRDRPIDESLRSSLMLADYTTALDRAGLLTILERPGPFTVFAIPNPVMETAQTQSGGRLMDPSMIPSLRRELGYTIVPGHFTDAVLRQMIAKARGPVGLATIYGDVLTVSVEPATNQLLLSDPQGQTNRIWLSSMPQSNGVLYATQSMLVPVVPTPATR